MLKRLLRPRWLVLTALILIVGLALGIHIQSPGRVAAGPQPVPPGKLAAVAAKTEKLHNRTAARTKEEDPDDLPPAVSPERAAQIALQTVRGAHGRAASSAGSTTAGVNSQNGQGQRSLGTKHVQGRAVFAVVVDGTEVDIDRETGAVVETHQADQQH